MNIAKVRLLIAAAGCLLAVQASAAATQYDADSAPGSRAAWLAMKLDFGGTRAEPAAVDFSFNLGGRPDATTTRAALPLMHLRRERGQWQALDIAGVDVLHGGERLQAAGEGGSWAPWLIGGLVGVGAVAIVIRYAGTNETPETDLHGSPGSR